jgi:hypothetical protein
MFSAVNRMKQTGVTQGWPCSPLHQQLASAQQVVEQSTVGVRHAFRVCFPQEPQAIF